MSACLMAGALSLALSGAGEFQMEWTHSVEKETWRETWAVEGGKLWLRVKHDRHIVTVHTSTDGSTWTKYPVQMEVSGYHHNVAGGFLALKPSLYAAGQGKVHFRNFRYRALD